MSLGTVIGIAGVFVVEPRLPTSPTVRGLVVGGERLGHGTDATTFLRKHDARLRATPLTLTHTDGLRIETTYGELGAAIDIEKTVAAAHAIGHSGSLVKRLRETQQALRGQIDVPLVYKLDFAAARRIVAAQGDALAKKALNAELDLEGHAKISDVPGRELDVATTLRAIDEGFQKRPPTLALITKPVEAEITVNDLEDIDISKVLATFDTKFRTWKVGRSANVHLAAGKLNGLIIRPRQTVSFNERVGPRSVDAGFQKAPEIVGDELTIGIGGGTCQVSSTLYGAALYGGFKIVDRRSHSRPSSYTRLGLDATVAYPKVDLKLMNPFNFTIVVHAFVPEKGLLRVELLGGEAVSDVEYRYGISGIEQYVRRITVKPWLKSGRAFRKQKGTRGMDVHSHVRIHYNDGRVEEKQYFSGYRATPEVFWVAPDYDEEELPPLPDHAKGVEGRLEADGSDVYPTTG